MLKRIRDRHVTHPSVARSSADAIERQLDRYAIWGVWGAISGPPQSTGPGAAAAEGVGAQLGVQLGDALEGDDFGDDGLDLALGHELGRLRDLPAGGVAAPEHADLVAHELTRGGFDGRARERREHDQPPALVERVETERQGLAPAHAVERGG